MKRENTSAEWVKTMLAKYSMNQSELADQLGVDRHTVSKLLSEKGNMTKWHRAAFYYYFLSRRAKDADQILITANQKKEGE